jgi:hypothetical protein
MDDDKFGDSVAYAKDGNLLSSSLPPGNIKEREQAGKRRNAFCHSLAV